jgi:hypothetical protein
LLRKEPSKRTTLDNAMACEWLKGVADDVEAAEAERVQLQKRRASKSRAEH